MGNVETMAMEPAGDANKATMEVPVGDDVEAIPKWKGEWRMCGSQFCSNCYFVGAPNGCCATDFQVFLCCANDSKCCIWADAEEQFEVPKMCTLMPFCVAYPTCGCCTTVGKVFADDPKYLETITARKHDMIVQQACCCPGCAGNNYCLVPYTCCENSATLCCCWAQDSALPCSPATPCACVMCGGFMVYPVIGCCNKVKDVFPDSFGGDV